MEWIDNPLSVERLLTEARINEVITNIDKNTIIYTEYVESGIVDKLSKAVRSWATNWHCYHQEKNIRIKSIGYPLDWR